MFLQLTEAQSWAIGAAVAFMCMDMLTGFIGAVINKCVSSSKMREGIGHKALLSSPLPSWSRWQASTWPASTWAA